MAKKTYYYCTCSTSPDKRRLELLGRTPFREVEANSEGICVDCGYYAVSFYKRIDTGTRDFYNHLFPQPEKESLRTKGGLSIITQRESRKYYAEKRAKKTDLDL